MEGKKTITFWVTGAKMHPDERHLGSRLWGKAELIEYKINDKVVLQVKDKNMDWIKDYMKYYLSFYDTVIREIEVF